MRRSRDFYLPLLGAEILLDSGRLAALAIAGGSVLLLFQRGAITAPLPTDGGVVPPHGAEGPQHVAFAIAADDLSNWRSHLQDCNVAVESEVTWPRGGVSLYVRDPDGHSVEFVTPGLWTIY